jgi:hypothetical protein
MRKSKNPPSHKSEFLEVTGYANGEPVPVRLTSREGGLRGQTDEEWERERMKYAALVETPEEVRRHCDYLLNEFNDAQDLGWATKKVRSLWRALRRISIAPPAEPETIANIVAARNAVQSVLASTTSGAKAT